MALLAIADGQGFFVSFECFHLMTLKSLLNVHSINDDEIAAIT